MILASPSLNLPFGPFPDPYRSTSRRLAEAVSCNPFLVGWVLDREPSDGARVWLTELEEEHLRSLGPWVGTCRGSVQD